MADTARNDPEAVRRLARALERYVREAVSGTESVAFARARVDHDITTETGARRRRLEAAKLAYRSCVDGEGECSSERHELDRATAALEAAQRAQRVFSGAAVDYDLAAARFTRVVGVLTTEAKQVLGLIAVDLDRYNKSASQGLGGAAPAAYTDSARAVRSGGGDGGGAGAGLDRPPGFPSGYAMVPLSLIDTGDSRVHGPGDFKSDVSPADLEWGLDTFFQVIMPAMARGKGLAYFQNRDAQEKRFGSRSYADTFTGFLGANEAPRLTRQPDGRYTVDNGYHRVWVAQRMGLDAIPGQVIE